MGSYNTLIVPVKCSECGNAYEGKVQFRYADSRQRFYRIGDKLAWGGNDVGKPGQKHVKAYGILENDRCDVCMMLNTSNEFDIYIFDDTIQGIDKLNNLDDYRKNEGNFHII